MAPAAWLPEPQRNSGRDARDLDQRVLLAVGLLALVVLAAAELDDDHLVRLAVGFHGGRDLGASDERLADLDVGAGAHEQNLVELDRGTSLRLELLDANDRTLADAVLLTARVDDRKHVLEPWCETVT